MTIPVYSVVAYSGTGKTTLLEKLIPALAARGLRVAVVKHDAHKFEIDREGKDSWRFTQAGAVVTALISSEKAAVIDNRPVAFEEVVARVTDVDVILTEGYKTGAYPKIALRRAEFDFAVNPDECFALLSDAPVAASEVPHLHIDDADGLAELIMQSLW
ncbi:MAG: molybdopterin-guanine dinucleotide biosynthesis protein B [Oscillospiraceae bacterium]|jgi:molybdopterin-guanine dinucleotide biosynthesis protein MobB|nr:molybdopterin-guanine dinucleotide biosynthesis protein B [Oscillospiraceae bacterium]